MNRQAIRDFFITVFFLGLSFIIALLSAILAEQLQPRPAAIAAAISLLLATVGAIYIIPRLARNIRLEMLRFAVRTSVTVEGVLFFVFLTVIGFAAWNTANNLLYLVLSAMIAFLIAANLIGRVTLSDVSVQLRFPDHIYAGEPANLNINVTNHKRFLPSYSFVVEALSDKDDDYVKAKREIEKKEAVKSASKNSEDDDEDETTKNGLGKLAYFLLIPARSTARQRIQHTFARRGRYQITGFRIASKFPAGFFKKWRRIDATGEIIVYPNPQSIDDTYHTLPILAGQIQSQIRGYGDELYTIRRYLPSDQMRHIDWKATAKASEMMVREYTREDERRLTIVFDTVRRVPRKKAEKKAAAEKNNSPENSIEQSANQGFEEKFEKAIIQAASLANHFIFEQSEVELITTDEKLNVRSGSGHDHLYNILRSLAMLEPINLLKVDGEETQEKPVKRGFFSRWFGADDDKAEETPKTDARPLEAWKSFDTVPVLANERRYKVLITSAPKGTIPANVWRRAHVVFMEDL
ncbi:MAG: DUF58 domain-containing protein [Acidobacteriota bacterium]